jgi:carbonic anhydrase
LIIESLLIVLGHESCGAVAAAVAEAKEPGHIADVIKAIAPAVEETRGKPGDPVANAIRANALDIAARLRNTSPVISEKVKDGHLTIIDKNCLKYCWINAETAMFERILIPIHMGESYRLA